MVDINVKIIRLKVRRRRWLFASMIKKDLAAKQSARAVLLERKLMDADGRNSR